MAGAASVVTLPLAIYLTRFSEAYELLQAGFAIPVAGALGVVAIVLASRARRRNALSLARRESDRRVQAGRVLGVIGVCLALAGLVALGVYGLLEYVGGRE